MSEVNLKECVMHPATYAQSLLDRAESAEARAAQLEAERDAWKATATLKEHDLDTVKEQRDALRVKFETVKHALSCIASWSKLDYQDKQERAAFQKWAQDALETVKD